MADDKSTEKIISNDENSKEVRSILNAKEFGEIESDIDGGDTVAVGEGNAPLDYEDENTDKFIDFGNNTSESSVEVIDIVENSRNSESDSNTLSQRNFDLEVEPLNSALLNFNTTSEFSNESDNVSINSSNNPEVDFSDSNLNANGFGNRRRSETSNSSPSIQSATNFSLSEDGTLTLTSEQLLANASDVDGDNLTVENLNINGGTLEANSDGSWTFTPDEDFNGDIDLTYDVSDGTTTTSTGGTITVEAVNDAPDVESETNFTMNEDGTLTLTSEQLLANASDIDGDNLTVENLKINGGTVVSNDDGTWTFTPDENFNGDLDLIYDVSDGTTTTSTGGIITVEAVNDAPEISDTTNFSLNEDGTLTITEEQLLQNASDVDGDNLTVENLNINGGTVVSNDDVTWTFTPDEDFNGDIDLTYDVSDGTTTTSTGGIITVEAVNDAPDIESDTNFSMNEDGTLTITEEQLLQNASDVDGDNLTVENLTVNGGTLEENSDGTWTFTPDENFNGDLDLTYDVSDGTTTTSTGGTITVNEVNDAPEISDNTNFIMNEDGTLTLTSEQLLANASDIDGDNLTVENLNINGGTLEENSDGTWTFTPDEDFNGDLNLTYDISDGTTTTSTGGIITVNAVNDAPDVESDTKFSMNEDGTLTLTSEQLLANASDIDGDNLTVENLNINGGTVVSNDDGTWTFTPDEDFNGDIDLTYDVSDGTTTTSTSGTITVEAVNDAPEVSDNTNYSMNEDGTLTITEEQLLQNASDVDGDNLTVETLAVNGGTVISNDDGTWTFTPDEDFNGDLNLTYDVSDGTTTTSTGGTITVGAVNDAPDVESETNFTMNEDGTLTLTSDQLLANSSDVDGDNLTVENLTINGGTVVSNDDGTWTFTPDEDFNGDLDLSYDVSDGTTTTSTGGTITVEAVNDAPEISDNTNFTMNEDGTLTITESQLLANASDVDGDNLTVENLNINGGTVVSNDDGTWTFTPDEDFNGDLDLTYDVSDGTTTTSTGGTITVNEVNDAPEVSDNTNFTMNEDGTLRLTSEQLLANASDVDGDNLTVENLNINGGTVVSNDDGTWTFTPDEDFNGDIDLTYDVSDGTTTTSTGGIITVEAVNDAPEVIDNTNFTMNEDGTLTITSEQLLANASDIDGDNLSVENLNINGGTVISNDDGSWTFTPDEDFNGELDLTYDVSDGTTTTSTGGIITVEAVNDAPEISDTTNFSLYEDGTLTITEEQLLQNASDVDGDNLTVENLNINGGTVVSNDDGTWTFTPDEDFNGDLDLTYDVSDGTTTTSTGGIITVEAVNDAPDVISESNNLLINGSFEDYTNGPNTGDWSYTSAENVNGWESSDSIELWNNYGTSAPDGTDTIVELDSDFAVDSISQTIDTVEGKPYQLSIDLNGRVEGSSDVEVWWNGELISTISPETGEWNTYTVELEGSGEPSELLFKEVDSQNNTFGTLMDNVSLVDTSPTFFTMNEDGTLNITSEELLANASDIDGDSLSVENINIENGNIVDNTDGTWTFTPDENFNGQIHLTYDVSDGIETTPASGIVYVKPINDAPEINDNTNFTMNEDGTLTLTTEQLLANTSDVEGDNLTVENLNINGGTVAENGNGTWTFTPEEDFNGELALTYDVSDGTTSTPTGGTITVESVNDAPEINDNTNFTMNEDGTLTLTTEQLLANTSDVEGDNLTVENLNINGGTVVEKSDGTWTFTPEEDFNGELALTYDVSDGTTTTSTGGIITVEAVNDAPNIESDTNFSMNEDGTLTLTSDQLLANASDVDGDNLLIENLSINGGTIEQNPNGNWIFTPDENFNGDLDLTYDVSDGTNTTQTVGTITVSPVNDAPEPGEHQTFEVDENAGQLQNETIKLSAQPQYGTIQVEIDGNWVEMDTQTEYKADANIKFIPDDNIAELTSDTSVGTFDNNASLDDWGELIDSKTLYINKSGVEITVESSDDDLMAWNGSGARGHGIGDSDADGLSRGESLIVTVEGEEINQVTFGLDGLGSWFDESSKNATQVVVRAYDDDGELIGEQGGYRESGTYTDQYTFTFDQPIHHFELTTQGGNGNYVVQNMTVSKTVQEDIEFTTTNADGTTTTQTIDLNLENNMEEQNLTEQIDDPIEVTPEDTGALVITQEDLLVDATDIDSEDLSIVDLQVENGEIIDNENGTWTFIPEEDYSGDVELSYGITDGEETVMTTGTIIVNDIDPKNNFTSQSVENDTITVESVNSAPKIEAEINFTMTDNGLISITKDLEVESNINLESEIDLDEELNADVSIDSNNPYTITEEQLLQNASDIDNDDLTVENFRIVGAEAEQNNDGSWTITPDEDFEGDLELSYDVSDGITSTTAYGKIIMESNDDLLNVDTDSSLDGDGLTTNLDLEVDNDLGLIDSDIDIIGNFEIENSLTNPNETGTWDEEIDDSNDSFDDIDGDQFDWTSEIDDDELPDDIEDNINDDYDEYEPVDDVDFEDLNLDF